MRGKFVKQNPPITKVTTDCISGFMNELKARSNTVHQSISGRVNHPKPWNVPSFTIILTANNNLSFENVEACFEEVSFPKKNISECQTVISTSKLR